MRLVIPYALFWARNDAMHSESPHDEVANSEKPWELFENQNTKKKKEEEKESLNEQIASQEGPRTARDTQLLQNHGENRKRDEGTYI
jgi:hypothetical protein